nr:chromate efflux transporter [Actinomycetota bacterium]
KLGFINFGGPAGQIALMHQELVDKRRWISNGRYLHALNYCMLLPGPEAQQLAIYIGWLLNGNVGGIAAGVLFVLPAALLMLGLAWLYAVHADVAWVAAIFYGLGAAVIGIVGTAVIRIGGKALKHPILLVVAASAFVAIFVLQIAFPIVIVAAAIVGFVGTVRRPDIFTADPHDVAADESPTVIGDEGHESVPGLGRSAAVIGTGLLVWWGPLLVVALVRGREDVLTQEAIFFSQAAMVTFGGAYAVLSYINQATVQHFGWLDPGQMVAGLGLAESTPGPLILLTEFVGFLGAYRFPGGLDPVVAGSLGALVTVWATFAPCFLWIFLGAPYIEHLRGNARLNGALTGVTAAVVGVILNLAVTFGVQTLFDEVRRFEVISGSVPVPVLSTLDPFAAVVAAVAFIGLWRYRWNVVPVIAASGVAGVVFRYVAL